MTIEDTTNQLEDRLKKIDFFLSVVNEGNKSVTPEVIKEFLVLVLSVISNTKKDFEELSATQLADLKDALEYITSQYETQFNKLAEKGDTAIKEINNSLQDAKKVLNEIVQQRIKTDEEARNYLIEIKASNDGIVTRLSNQITELKNSIPSPYQINALTIRDSLQTLQGDERLDISSIKGLEEWVKKNSKGKVNNNTPEYIMGGSGYVKTITAGSGVTVSVDANNNYTISASGGSGSGDVVGGSSSIDNTIARYDGTTGKAIQSSGVVIDDSDNVSAAGLTLSSLTASTILISNGSKAIISASTSTYPSLTEFAYVKGVTSAIQTQMDLKAPLASPTFTGTVTVPLTPSNTTDAASKGYVDAVAQGLSVKGSVLLATASALPTNTYLSNVITITATGTLTVDGTVTALGDRILVKDESSALKNGIYTVTTAGAIGVAAILTRSTDMDVSTEFAGAFVFVESGTVNTAAGFVCTNTTAPTVGTTAINFTQFSGAGEITAGAGLTKTGNTLDVVGTTNRITVNADSIDISSSYVGQNTITTLGTIATGVWNGTVITPVYGGTGVANNVASTITISGSYALTLTLTNTTNVTLPTTGTLATLAGAETFSSKTLTAPKFASGGFIADANGNELLIFTTTASAVNEITLINAATGNAPQLTASGGDTDVDLKLVSKGAGIVKGTYHRFQVRLLDSATAITTGTSKGGDFRISKFAITVKAVGAYVDTAPTGASLLTIDINEAGTTIISTKITLDASEKTSQTAATPPVISDSAIAADAIVTFDVDQVGSTVAGSGLVVWVDYIYT